MGSNGTDHPDPKEHQERVLARLEETVWVVEAQGGRLDSFNRLVRRYEAPLLYFLRRLIQQPDQALDAYQEVWLDAWRSLPKLLAPEAFRVWMYRIAHAKAAQFIRQEIREQRWTTFSEGHEAAFIPSETPHDAEAVHVALGCLPPEQREILTLFYLDDLKLEEIARVIEKPVGTVKSRLHTARLNLRRIIEKGRL